MAKPELIYIDDSLPGITRKGAGKGWAYYDTAGALIKDAAEKRRLNAIALPPAYDDAWFCPAPNGHILATGYDEAGRKQYRYHPDFQTMKAGEKFDRCRAFGEMLPLVRKRMAEDLHDTKLTRARVVASVVRLLDLGFLRIGNASYAKRNKNYGATTLLHKHAEVNGDHLRFAFRGKSGKERDVELDDAELAQAIAQLQHLPGQELFQYVDPNGERHTIGSGEVNEYLSETMGEAFTAKNFRTWHGSAVGFEALARSKGKMAMGAMLDVVADRLGNTPTVARNAYIHPAVLDLVDRQEEWRAGLRLPRSTKWMARHERGLLAFLESAPSAGELLTAD